LESQAGDREPARTRDTHNAPHPTKEADMAAQTATKTDTRDQKLQSHESILDAIQESEEAIVDTAKQWVDRVGEIVPDLWEKPVAEGAPAIRQIADAAFDLTRGILDAQRDFAKRIIDSVVDETRKLN